MRLLKKKFLGLSIRSQVIFGVLTPAFCVCFQLFMLILVNIFILLNMSYIEILDLFDTIETQQIDSIAVYHDMNLLLSSEFSKTGVQWIRNMMENIENLQKKNQFNYTLMTSNLKLKYSYNHNINIDCSVSVKSKPKNDLLNILSPFINKTIDYRILNSKKQNFNSVLIMSKECNLTFMNSYQNLINYFNHDFKQKTEDYYNFIINNRSYVNSINQPNITNITIFINSSIMFYNSAYNNTQIFTLSPKFENDDLIISNYILGISNYSLNEIDSILKIPFRGIRIELFNFFENEILTKKSCEYFLNYSQLDLDIKKCQDFFNNIRELNKTNFSMNNDTKYIKRKIRIPLTTFISNNTSPILFKIGKYLLPDTQSLKLLNSNLFTFENFYLYVFKNENFILRNFNFVFYQYLSALFIIIFVNFFIWTYLLTKISFKLFKVSEEITTPINKLCELVKCFGKENSNLNKLIDDMKNIDSADQDITELYDICLKIIKGGFSENGKNKSEDDNFDLLQDSYNETFFIKTNNLIVDEEAIENILTSNSNKIFLYNLNKKTNNILVSDNLKENILNMETSENLISSCSNEERLCMNSLENYFKFSKKNHPFYDQFRKKNIIILE